MSRSAVPVNAVSVISTGAVRIHPGQRYGSRSPLYWWLLTSRALDTAAAYSRSHGGLDVTAGPPHRKAPLPLAGDFTYEAELLELGRLPGVGGRRRLAEQQLTRGEHDGHVR